MDRESFVESFVEILYSRHKYQIIIILLCSKRSLHASSLSFFCNERLCQGSLEFVNNYFQEKSCLIALLFRVIKVSECDSLATTFERHVSHKAMQNLPQPKKPKKGVHVTGRKHLLQLLPKCIPYTIFRPNIVCCHEKPNSQSRQQRGYKNQRHCARTNFFLVNDHNSNQHDLDNPPSSTTITTLLCINLHLDNSIRQLDL